jgi:hypothetical protein
VSDKAFYSPYVPFQLFREGEGFFHQPGAPLPQGAKEALKMVGVLLPVRHEVSVGGYDHLVGLPVVGVEGGPLAVALILVLLSPSAPSAPRLPTCTTTIWRLLRS